MVSRLVKNIKLCATTMRDDEFEVLFLDTIRNVLDVCLEGLYGSCYRAVNRTKKSMPLSTPANSHEYIDMSWIYWHDQAVKCGHDSTELNEENATYKVKRAVIDEILKKSSLIDRD